MNLYIRIKDGVPYNHPILESNFKQAFPSVDMDALPPEFAKFTRVPKPTPDEGKQIVSAECRYEWVGNEVHDVWYIVQEDITTEEPLEALELDSKIE